MTKDFIFKSLFASLTCIAIYSCSDVSSKTSGPSDVNAPINISKVVEQKMIIDSNQKVIYLTFDDGPQHGTVPVSDLCTRLRTKASFFMVGSHTEKKSDGFKIVDSIKKSYPLLLLANHSYSHANSKYKYFYQHPQMAFEDFMKNQQLLAVPYKIIRLPGNRAWVTNTSVKASNLVKPVCSLLDSAGYNVIGWDVEWSFNHKTANPVQSVDKMVRMIDSAFIKNDLHTKNHLVLLSHDRMFRSQQYLDSLSKLIEVLQAKKEYKFETVDHYPKLKALSN